MATEVQNPPQMSEEAFYELMKEQAAKVVAQAAAEQRSNTEPVTAPAASPIKINVFGHERSFSSPEDLGKAIEKIVADSQTAIAAAGAQRPVVVENPQAPPPIDMEEFVNRIQKDPVDAINYALHNKYGTTLEYLLDRAQRSEAVEGALVAMQFKEMTPDYLPTPQNGMVLEKVRQTLNVPYSVEGLGYAYNVARERRLLQERTAEEMQSPEVLNPRTPLPPSLSSTRSAPPNGTEDLINLVEQMNANDAEKFVKQFYASRS